MAFYKWQYGKVVVTIPLFMIVNMEYQTSTRQNRLVSKKLFNSTQQSEPPQVAIDQIIGIYKKGPLKKQFRLP